MTHPVSGVRFFGIAQKKPCCKCCRKGEKTDYEQEEYYREAAKQINYKLNRYRSRFPKFDSNKHWAMTAVELAYEVVRLQDSTDVEPYKDKLKELTDLMEKYIK